MTRDTAAQMLMALTQCWIRIRKEEGLDHLSVSSPNHGGILSGTPRGVVAHYTSSLGDWKGPVRWLFDPKAKASAHFIIARARHPRMDDFPELAGLGALVVPVVPTTKIAWHATWTNRTHLGIELVNRGKVLLHQGDRQWTHRQRRVPKGESIVLVREGSLHYKLPAVGFEVYRGGQLEAFVTLLKLLRALYPSIEARRILPHSAVQARSGSGKVKCDTGPLFPIHKIRRAVLHEGPTSFWDPVGNLPVGDDLSEPPDDFGRAAEDPPEAELKTYSPLDTSWEAESAALYTLGFDVEGAEESSPAAAIARSVFRRSMGLPEDYGLMGPLAQRIRETYAE